MTVIWLMITTKTLQTDASTSIALARCNVLIRGVMENFILADCATMRSTGTMRWIQRRITLWISLLLRTCGACAASLSNPKGPPARTVKKILPYITASTVPSTMTEELERDCTIVKSATTVIKDHQKFSFSARNANAVFKRATTKITMTVKNISKTRIASFVLKICITNEICLPFSNVVTRCTAYATKVM